MNDKPLPPHVFANHVLKQMIEHSFGGDLVIEYEDYQVIRTAFRAGGGSWREIANGNPTHIELASKYVSAWGQMPERRSTKDRVV